MGTYLVAAKKSIIQDQKIFVVIESGQKCA